MPSIRCTGAVPLVARAMVAILVAMTAVAADGSIAAMRVVDVPGVSGRAVSIVGAARLADGGAIVVGTLTPSLAAPGAAADRRRTAAP